MVKNYPQPLRRIKYDDEKIGTTYNFLTNNFVIPAQVVANSDYKTEACDMDNQLNLFKNLTGQ